jgi:hypothetical protein
MFSSSQHSPSGENEEGSRPQALIYISEQLKTLNFSENRSVRMNEAPLYLLLSRAELLHHLRYILETLDLYRHLPTFPIASPKFHPK